MNENIQKILIIDDNKSNAFLLKETLRCKEYKITTYTNPVIALKKIEKEKYDLLILDIVMPKISGFDFANIFKTKHPHTPILFISAYDTRENKVKSYNLGSYGYIDKPIDIETVRAKVRNTLNIKKLKDKLLAEKEKLDNIFKFSSDEIILTDINFNVISKNSRIFLENTGNILEILIKNNLESVAQKLQDFKIASEQNILLDINLPPKYTSTNISKIFDISQNLEGFLIIIRDVTESVMVERQKNQFIATLTHDLKTPVRAETRALEMLVNGTFGKLTEEQENIVKEILASSKFMGRMTDNLLTRYKLDGKNFKLRKEKNSLKETIYTAVNNIKYLLESKQQTLRVNYNLKQDEYCFDDIELSRVIVNLLANASEYSHTDKEISLSVYDSDNSIQIKIKDNGFGIQKKDINHIFDEFNSSSKRFKKVGSGLGLFITKEIVNAHGGTITVKSNYGKGSEFIVILPHETLVSSV